MAFAEANSPKDCKGFLVGVFAVVKTFLWFKHF